MSPEYLDAKRWQYVRDVLWRHHKRDDFPETLSGYFYRDDVDNKYPNSFALDRAIDALIVEDK